MREAIASAPGKVNLLLRSGTPEADGYHPLFTVFESVSLREYVVARTRKRPGVGVQTLVYQPGTGIDDLPTFDPVQTRIFSRMASAEHLAVRAAKALRPLVAGAWGATSAGLQLTVHKTIPAAAGMAGGSADAAATLVAINQLWQLGLDVTQLEAIGRQLGADVPSCIRGGISLGVGHGDHLTSLEGPADGGGKQHWWALAFSEDGLSTPKVFDHFDRMNLGQSELPTELSTEQLSALWGQSEQLVSLLGNDLAVPALSVRPQLAQIGQESLNNGALGWIISGSGPTVAALASGPQEAEKICQAWRRSPLVFRTAAVRGPSGSSRLETVLPQWSVDQSCSQPTSVKAAK